MEKESALAIRFILVYCRLGLDSWGNNLDDDPVPTKMGVCRYGILEDDDVFDIVDDCHSCCSNCTAENSIRTLFEKPWKQPLEEQDRPRIAV